MPLATLSSYSREQLSDVLRILKAYKTGLVQIGHRAYLADPKETMSIRVRVEYPVGASLEDIRSFAGVSVREHFAIETIPEDIVFVETPALIGGIRIFA